jgi:hypothetical protein
MKSDQRILIPEDRDMKVGLHVTPISGTYSVTPEIAASW